MHYIHVALTLSLLMLGCQGSMQESVRQHGDAARTLRDPDGADAAGGDDITGGDSTPGGDNTPGGGDTGTEEDVPRILSLANYEVVAMPTGMMSLPLSITVDAEGSAWSVAELHKFFQHVEREVHDVENLQIPMGPTGCFSDTTSDPSCTAETLFSLTFGDPPREVQTSVSLLAEKITTTPAVRNQSGVITSEIVWFTEGGNYLREYMLELRNDPDNWPKNHSRIVGYDRISTSYTVINLPGNWNEVIGLTWDTERVGLWFTEGGTSLGRPRIGFIPFGSLVTCQSLNHPIFLNDRDFCPNPDNGFQYHNLPVHDLFPTPEPADGAVTHNIDSTATVVLPGHLIVAHDGDIWFTNLLSNNLGRLDPDTEELTLYPLPRSRKGFWGWIEHETWGAIQNRGLGGGPWEILQLEDGDIVFNEYIDNTIGRLQWSRRDDLACLSLDAAGINPCIREIDVSIHTPQGEVDWRIDTHTMDLDVEGGIWFTHGTLGDGFEFPSVGYLGSITWEEWGLRRSDVAYFPRLSEVDPTVGDHGFAGIKVDPQTGNLWLAGYVNRRLVLLKKAAVP